jgi:hypothetical protein
MQEKCKKKPISFICFPSFMDERTGHAQTCIPVLPFLSNEPGTVFFCVPEVAFQSCLVIPAVDSTSLSLIKYCNCTVDFTICLCTGT